MTTISKEAVAKDSEQIAEISKRVKRIETRVMTMGTALGVDMGDADKIRVDVPGRAIYLRALDVSFSRVIKQAKFKGLGGQTVRIVFNGEDLGTVTLKP